MADPQGKLPAPLSHGSALYQKKALALLLLFRPQSRVSTFDRLERLQRFELLEPTSVFVATLFMQSSTAESIASRGPIII
jgi:hypothetical protein